MFLLTYLFTFFVIYRVTIRLIILQSSIFSKSYDLLIIIRQMALRSVVLQLAQEKYRIYKQGADPEGWDASPGGTAICKCSRLPDIVYSDDSAEPLCAKLQVKSVVTYAEVFSFQGLGPQIPTRGSVLDFTGSPPQTP